jgi:hypothetical protein
MLKNSIRWNLTFNIQATPQVLKQIEKVDYSYQANHTKFTKPITVTSRANNFKFPPPGYYLSVYASPRIIARAYFMDGQNRSSSTQANVKCSLELCPINLSYTPKMHGSQNIEISGNVTAKDKNDKITKITIAWGDRKTCNGMNCEIDGIPTVSKVFSFNHTYATVGSYIINIGVSDTNEVSFNKTVTTTALLLEPSFPSGSRDMAISAKTNSVLRISTSSGSMDLSNSPTALTVFGKLSNLTGGYGIPNEPINITVGKHQYSPTDTKTGMHAGEFTKDFNPNELGEGTFVIVAEPQDPKYAGINVTEDLLITRTFTRDQIIAIVSIAAAAIGSALGLLVTIPPHRLQKKRAEKFRKCILDINTRFIEFKQKQSSRELYLDDLEDLRRRFMNMIASQELAEEQYKMLDDIISSYINRAK